MTLIDGNAIIHRAYHAMPPMRSPDGKLVSVVYGFISMLMKINRDLSPSHMVVTFDRPGPTFREKMYPQYQQQRPKLDDDFISQIPLVHDVVKAFGIPIYECDGFEADDVIGTIAKQVFSRQSLASLKLRRSGSVVRKSEDRNLPAGKAGLKTESSNIDQIIIITGDRDILQLVEDEKVLVFMPTKGLSEGKIYSEKDVVVRLGITPKLIPEHKALAGDPSDNYPGVLGIGPKTAVTILNTFGSIDALYRAVEAGKTALSKGVIEKLKLGKQSAYLGLNLATIRKDAPITFSSKTAYISSLDSLSARKELEKYGFHSLIRRLTRSEQNKGVRITMKDKIEKEEQTSQQQLF